jgi:hypothetical protein
MKPTDRGAGRPPPSRERQLWHRQQRLLARSAVLRERLGSDLATLQAPLALADSAIAAGRWLNGHRELVGAGALLLALRRPRRALRWVGRGWALWRAGRRLWPLLLRLGGWAAPAGTGPRRPGR